MYVLNAIGRILKGKASDPERVSVTLVQDAAKLYFVLASIKIQLITQKWNLSGNFESSKGTPIYNIGARTNVNNYWPIYVISVSLRMLERVSHDQILEFL